jgi:hypothetical protein
MLAGAEPLKKWLGEVHGPFAEWINERNERIGSVFVRGPRIVEVPRDGVAKVIGYIHRNPVRAGLVENPGDSTWTSHGAYVGLAERPAWLDVATGLDLAGFCDGKEMDAWLRATPLDRVDHDAAVGARRAGRPPGVQSELGAAQESPF